jgi:hypothetical protein
MIHDQLMSVLKKNGLEKIIVKKKDKFNHDEMECLMCEKEEGVNEDEIVNVLMSGYKLNGKILRATKVSVGEPLKQNNIKEKLGEEEIKEKMNENCFEENTKSEFKTKGE